MQGSVPSPDTCWPTIGLARLNAAVSQAPEDQTLQRLLATGMEFLVAAVDDLADEVPHPKLKFGLVHLVTGMEILFKVRLAREHWSLVFSNVNQADRARLETGDFRSVSLEDAVKRLGSVCAVRFTQEHEQVFNVIRGERNKVLHMGYVGQQSQLRPVAAKTLNFLISFISNELEPNGLSEETNDLLEQIRSGLAKIQHYVQERSTAIQPILEAAHSTIVQCPLCLEAAMMFDGDQAKCEFCGFADDGENAANMFAHNVLELSKYRIVKQGGEWPVHQCPECGHNAFVEGVKGMNPHTTRWVCFSCGVEADNNDVWPCMRCNEPVISGEGSYAFCDTCSYT